MMRTGGPLLRVEVMVSEAACSEGVAPVVRQLIANVGLLCT